MQGLAALTGGVTVGTGVEVAGGVDVSVGRGVLVGGGVLEGVDVGTGAGDVQADRTSIKIIPIVWNQDFFMRHALWKLYTEDVLETGTCCRFHTRG
jgi:hypothetical protein